MYIITLFSIIAFICSFLRDRRSFLNPALLISSLILGYISILKLFYDLGLVAAHNLLLFMMLFALPLVIFISAVFLIYNGCILLKREGMSKTNLLSLSLGVLILLFFALMFT